MIRSVLVSLPQFLQGIASVILGYVMGFIIMEFDDGSSMVELGKIYIVAGTICLLVWMIDVIITLVRKEPIGFIHWTSIVIAGILLFCFVLMFLMSISNIIFGIIFVIIWILASLVPNIIIIFYRRK